MFKLLIIIGDTFACKTTLIKFIIFLVSLLLLKITLLQMFI